MKYWVILAVLLAACSDAPLKKGPGTPDVDMNEADQAEDMSELDMEDMAFPDMPDDMRDDAGLDDMGLDDMEVDFAQPDMPDDMEPDLPPVIDPAGDEDSDGLTNDDTDTGTSNPTPATTLNAVASAAGSVDSQGLPFVYSWAASGFGAMLPLAIRGILQRHQFEARGVIVEQGGDAGDVGDFLVRLEADTTSNGCAALPTEDSDNDTYPETFPAVVAGTNLCWKLEFAPNTLVPRNASIQEIRGSFQTQGADGATASRPLLLIVPPIVGQP